MKYGISSAPAIFLSVMVFLVATLGQSSKVYICRSKASYAYHNSHCQGLRNCTHRIDTVSVKKAMEIGYRKACGYCYR